MASTAATAPEEEEEKAPQFSSEQLHQLLMELLPQKNEQQQCPNGRRHCAAAAGTSVAANAAALSSSGSVQQQQHKVRQSTTTSRRSNKAKQQQRRVPQPTESEDPSAASPASPPFAALDNHNSFGADQLLAALAAVASASTALQDPTTTAISLEELGKAMLEQMGREFGEQAHQMFAALAELAPGASPDELADAAALAMAAQLGLQQQQQMDTMATGTAAFWQQMLAQMGTTAAQEKDDSGIVADQSMEQEAQMLFPLPLMPSPPATVPSLPPPRAPKRRRPPISSQPPAVPLPTSNQNEQQLQQVLMEWMAQMMQQPQQNQSDNANGHGQQQQGMQALVEAALAGGLMGAEELAQALLQQMVPEGDQKSDFDNSTTTTGADDAQERKNYGTTQQAITPIGHKQRNLCAIGKGIVDNVNSDAANIVAAAPEQSPPPLVFEPNALCQQLLIAQNGQQQQQHMGAGEAATWQQQLALQQVLAQLGSAVNSSNGNGNSGFQLDQQQQQLLALSAAMLPTNVQLMKALLPGTRQEQSHDTQHQVKVEPQQQQEEVHKHTDAENNNVPLSLFAELKSEEGENGTTVATMLLAHGQQQQQQRRKKPREGKRQHIGGQMPGMGVQQQQTPRLCTVPGTGTLTAKSEKSLGALLRQQPEGVERAKELEELEQFANFFKKQRIRYGFTQGDVGVALGKRYGTDFSQTTISRFEALNLSFKNMCKLRPLLQDWLHETEQVLAAGASVQDVMEGVALRRVAAAVAVPNEAANAAAAPCSQQSSPGSGGFLACTGATAAALDEGPTAKMLPPFKKRRKRTNLDSAQKVSLDAFFRIDPRPDNVRMNEIATLLDLEQDVVRVWFCNRRQKLRKL